MRNKPHVDRVKVRVLKRHVKRAQCLLIPENVPSVSLRCKVCPIAQALLEQGCTDVNVRQYTVTCRIGGQRRAASLPKSAIDAIELFDLMGEMPTPFSFSLKFHSREWFRQNVGNCDV